MESGILRNDNVNISYFEIFSAANNSHALWFTSNANRKGGGEIQ